MSVEEKLLKYRQQKSKEYTAQKSTFKIAKSSSSIIPSFLTRTFTRIENSLSNNKYVNALSSKCQKIPVLNNPRVLKILLWLLVLGFFISIEFGLVFVIISGFAFIFINTGTTKRGQGEKSAYSVFNDNCERINGTLTAEQFEKEIRHGSQAVS